MFESQLMLIPGEKLTEAFISLIKIFLKANSKANGKEKSKSKLRDKNLFEESLVISY